LLFIFIHCLFTWPSRDTHSKHLHYNQSHKF